MNFLQKILVVLFILISGSLKAGEVTDLYENEEFDAAYRLGYAKALNGDPESLFIIGKILIGGEGSSEENVKKGLKFVKSAADDDYQKAIIFLAINYEEGEFSKQNNKLALKYYEKCAENGSSKCKKKRDKLYIKLSGAISKKACKSYNKRDKKLANKIARCIVSGHLEGNASSYYLISFDKGNTNDFIKAANRMLKPKSGANLNPLVQKLPEFYEKASDKQINKLSKIANKYGYDFKSCNIKKSKLGFKSKGNPLSCVFAAIAGDTQASPIVAKWWRDGDKGLPKSREMGLAMMKNAETGDNVNYAAILKGLEDNPKDHFKKAKSFLLSSPLSKKIIGKELKLEAELLAAEAPFEFTEDPKDIGVVLGHIDWNVLKPKIIAKLIYLFKTDYKDEIPNVISSSIVIKNMKEIQFSKKLFVELIKQKDSSYAHKFLKERIFGDCDALKYALNNKNSHKIPIETIQQAQMMTGTKCIQIPSKNKKSMDILMKQAEIDFDANKVPIELSLKVNNPCPNYNQFLQNKNRIGLKVDLLDVDFNKLNKQCVKDTAVLYERAQQAYFKKNFDLAHKLSKQSCNAKNAKGCELIASILQRRQSSAAKRFAFNETGPAMINYLKKGHKAKDDKSSAMLFDLYNQNPITSQTSNFKEAQKLIDYLSTRESVAAQVRVKIDCFSNREMNPLNALFKSCNDICIWARDELSNEELYDVATFRTIQNTADNTTCCPEGSGQCTKKRSKKSNISNSSSNQ